MSMAIKIFLRKMQTSLLHASHEQATLVKLQSNFIALRAIRALFVVCEIKHNKKLN
jgi:hypothetical protein